MRCAHTPSTPTTQAALASEIGVFGARTFNLNLNPI
jgi:hypothetical protein